MIESREVVRATGGASKGIALFTALRGAFGSVGALDVNKFVTLLHCKWNEHVATASARQPLRQGRWRQRPVRPGLACAPPQLIWRSRPCGGRVDGPFGIDRCLTE